MHELQQILLQKLPRLGELTFGCEVKLKVYGECLFLFESEGQNFFRGINGKLARLPVGYDIEILGHPFTHADILEALGEDWAMTSYRQLLRQTWVNTEQLWLDADIPGSIMTYPRLPQNLSDLSLPEYEETRKQLISLLK